MSMLTSWFVRNQSKINAVFCFLSAFWIVWGIHNQNYGIVMLNSLSFYLCYRGIRF
jgi:hypothetical protein